MTAIAARSITWQWRQAGSGLPLAAALMERVEQRLLAMGCPKINVLVRTTNVQVIAFYEKLGYARDDAFSLGKRLIPDL